MRPWKTWNCKKVAFCSYVDFGGLFTQSKLFKTLFSIWPSSFWRIHFIVVVSGPWIYRGALRTFQTVQFIRLYRRTCFNDVSPWSKRVSTPTEITNVFKDESSGFPTIKTERMALKDCTQTKTTSFLLVQLTNFRELCDKNSNLSIRKCKFCLLEELLLNMNWVPVALKLQRGKQCRKLKIRRTNNIHQPQVI